VIPPLLKEKLFRRYWTGQTISLFGDQISALALPLLAVLGTGAGPAQMGYLTAAALIPNLLFSLLAGAWVDRLPYKRILMIVADVGRAVLLLWIPISYAMGGLTLTQLYAIAFLTGTFAVLFEVSRNTLFVALVDRSEYIDANALLNGSRAMSFVAGPSVGGVLVQVFSAPAALIADALSYILSAVLLGRINPLESKPSGERRLGIADGLAYIKRSVSLRSMLAASTTLNLFNYMFSALFILYASTSLHVNPGLLGVIIGGASVGAVLGAAFTGRLVNRFGAGRVFVASYLIFPAPLVLVPLTHGSQPVWLIATMLFVSEFLSGFGVMMLDIVGGSLQAALIPDHLRARVAGAHRTVNYGIRPIGALVGGALGAALGVHPTLWIATIGSLAAVLLLLPSPLPSMRRLPLTEGA
jgi:MFS family permease